jgi:hypothetical protein
VLDGRVAAGLRRIRRVRDELVYGGAPAPGLPGISTRILLEDYALAGETEAGLALAAEAVDVGRGAELWEAEIRRLRAVLLAETEQPEEAIAGELQRALAVATRQGARAFENRIRGTLAERRTGQDQPSNVSGGRVR